MITVTNTARVPLPDDDDLRATLFRMYTYEGMGGASFYNYQFEAGADVAYFPPNIGKLQRVAALLGLPIDDQRSWGLDPQEPFVLQPDFKLRDYQVEPAKQFYNYLRTGDGSGALSAGCGTGKSATVTRVVGQLGRRVLVIVDQSNLVQSWELAFKMCWGKQIQQLKKDTRHFADCCIVTFQLLNKDRELLRRIRDVFGTVVVDEAHVVTADTFRDVLMRINSHYRVGCSATYFKKYLPGEVLSDLIGPVAVTMVDPNALKPKVIWVDTGIEWPSNDNMEFASVTLPTLAGDLRRNSIILKLVERGLKQGRIICVIGIQNVQAETLANLTVRLGGKPKLYVGATSKKVDKDVIDGFASGKYNVLFTSKKLDKGTDIPQLDMLILARPNNNETATQQQTGRLTRLLEGKPEPIVFDLRDEGRLARSYAKNRGRWYKKLGYTIVEPPLRL